MVVPVMKVLKKVLARWNRKISVGNELYKICGEMYECGCGSYEWEAFEFGVFVFGMYGSGEALFVRVVVYMYVKAGDSEIGVFFIQSEHVFGVNLIFVLF